MLSNSSLATGGIFALADIKQPIALLYSMRRNGISFATNTLVHFLDFICEADRSESVGDDGRLLKKKLVA